MTILLDPHTLLWVLDGSPNLPMTARRKILDSEVVVSVASVWEIAIKSAVKKLDHGDVILAELEQRLAQLRFSVLPITLDHAMRSGILPLHHRDPFDRMLAAQAQAESLPIISNDKIFDLYGIRRIW